MKNKRFIAKCLTLAMIFALMIPTPVSAASSKGRLLKSVTRYTYNETKGRWEQRTSTSFVYNKKNYPKEIKETYVTESFLGIPYDAENYVKTASYKFKGKSPKSMKLKNPAGRVTETRKYKKGKLVSVAESENKVWDDGDYEKSNSSTKYAYNKKGIVKSRTGSDTSSEKEGTYVHNSSWNGTATYAITQTKKGVPKLIVGTSSGSYSWSDSDGDSGSYPPGTPYVTYTRFNKKGLATEVGTVDQAGNYKANNTIEYKTKKGKVTQAIIYSVNTDGSKKMTTMFKFKYTKKKASAARYRNMINSEIDYSYAPFFWY